MAQWGEGFVELCGFLGGGKRCIVGGGAVGRAVELCGLWMVGCMLVWHSGGRGR